MKKRIKSIDKALIVLSNSKLAKSEGKIVKQLVEDRLYDFGFIEDMYFEYKVQLKKKLESIEKRIKPIYEKYSCESDINDLEI